MKKLLAIVMVVAMMFSMSVIASADQTAEISYDGSTAVISVYTTAFSTFDVAVYGDAVCTSVEYDKMNFGMNVSMNSDYTYSGVSNKEAKDAAGNTYATVTGAGCVAADGSDIPYEGILATFTFADVAEGTVFTVATGAASVDDVTTAPVIATLTATNEPAPTESGDPEPAPTESGDPEPAPTESGDPEPAPTESGDPEPAPSESDEPAPVVPTTAPTTPSNGGSANAPQTADVAPIATMISLVVVAGLAIVALKKRATN